jgi:hypothetical protein
MTDRATLEFNARAHYEERAVYGYVYEYAYGDLPLSHLRSPLSHVP